ncbi:MAG: ClpXP protease specificity-enhancing factor [Gammaproteobacteria bacterium]|nr:ClpXP protease specificity-enhancing factor [Gammaproteobacteria bacterium]MBU1415544.1 ClpXP protease specificity-enhancing factor [Gammaproteobacteria bacterium]
MLSTKPYFVRAVFEWCVDQGLTPYISVVVGPNTRVPREFVKDGQIVLNIGPDATNQLLLGNEEITFQARFSGVAFPVAVPIDSVVAIFAKENGQGMAFEAAATSGDTLPTTGEVVPDVDPREPPPASPGRPHLTRIK